VLLAGAEGGAWRHAAHQVAARLGIALDAYRVGVAGDLIDRDGDWRAAYGVTPVGAALVRPDGMVGWRSVGDAQLPEKEITEALNRILGRVS